MKFERSGGILLHPTSLPGPYGIGDLGPQAYRFVDWLASTGCKLWQVLPLGPTGYGDSPYQCFSAFAGNPYLISPRISPPYASRFVKEDIKPLSKKLFLNHLGKFRIVVPEFSHPFRWRTWSHGFLLLQVHDLPGRG